MWENLSHVPALPTFSVELHSCLSVGEEVSEPFSYEHWQALVKQRVDQLLSSNGVVCFAEVE